jgi:hypothetical protein
MPDAQPGEETDDASVVSWITDVVHADRDDASRSTAPPPARPVSPHSLLHRVVDAERDPIR